VDISEILLTIAEVAVALAGFGGIAAGLGYRARGSWNEQDRFRLLVMVSVSLSLVFACLVPYALLNTGIPEAWRISSTLALLIPIGNLAIQYRLFKHGLPPGFSLTTTLSILVSNIGAFVLLSFVILQLADEQSMQGLYAASVLLLLLSPAILFLRLIITSFIVRMEEENSIDDA
jgi:hypothetical protein